MFPLVQLTRLRNQKQSVATPASPAMRDTDLSDVRFQRVDADWRNQLARDKRLCLNCFSSNHGYRACTSRFSCRTCGARHHTLLHRERPKMEIPQKAVASSPPTPNEADTPQVVPYSLHSIAVGIENNDSVAKARAIIDRGASTSLMTEALATTLRLKCHPQSLLLGGHFGEQRSNQCIVATLQLLQNQSLTQGMAKNPSRTYFLDLHSVPNYGMDPTIYHQCPTQR